RQERGAKSFAKRARFSCCEPAAARDMERLHKELTCGTDLESGSCEAVSSSRGSRVRIGPSPSRSGAAQTRRLRLRDREPMTDSYPIRRPSVPLRALALSVCALAVPVVAAALPEADAGAG